MGKGKHQNQETPETNYNNVEEDYLVENVAPSKLKKFLNFINLASLSIVMFCAFFLVRLLISRDPRSLCSCTKDEINRYYPTRWGFEQKLEVIFLSWAMCGFLVLLSGLGVMFFRFITLSSPLDRISSEPALMTAFNRIMLNTIAQSFIFLGFFGYWVLRQGDSEHAIRYIAIFAVARVLFFVGYTIQATVGLMQVRACGFIMTIMVNMILLAEIVGHSQRERIVNAGKYDFVHQILTQHLKLEF
jgi:hypothetical protein